jgi:spermidine synthase
MSEKIFESLNAASGVYFEATLVERRRTPFQLLEVYDTPELGRMFRLDGANMTSERDEFFYHENLVHPAAVAHPAPRRALVIGGGDGGSSEELLKHSTLESVHMAELDPEVIEVSKAQFAEGAPRRLRQSAPQGDGGRRLEYLRTTDVRYDIVAMDLTDPVGPVGRSSIRPRPSRSRGAPWREAERSRCTSGRPSRTRSACAAPSTTFARSSGA